MAAVSKTVRANQCREGSTPSPSEGKEMESIARELRVMFIVVPLLPGLVAVIIGVIAGYIMRWRDNVKRRARKSARI